MERTLRRVRADRAASDSGFTLIEMLVVVVIIGILAGISIPLYLNYRKGAENKTSESDVRAAIAAVEQYYTENNNTYPADQTGGWGQSLVFGNQTATVSANNRLGYHNNANTSYWFCGQNQSGGTIWVYNSATGQPVHQAAVQTWATCVANGT